MKAIEAGQKWRRKCVWCRGSRTKHWALIASLDVYMLELVKGYGLEISSSGLRKLAEKNTLQVLQLRAFHWQMLREASKDSRTAKSKDMMGGVSRVIIGLWEKGELLQHLHVILDRWLTCRCPCVIPLPRWLMSMSLAVLSGGLRGWLVKSHPTSSLYCRYSILNRECVSQVSSAEVLSARDRLIRLAPIELDWAVTFIELKNHNI